MFKIIETIFNLSAHSIQTTPFSKNSKRPKLYISSPSNLYKSIWYNLYFPEYPETITNDGDLTYKSISKPFAMPFIKVVLPAPSSPDINNKSPGKRDLPIFLPRSIVSSLFFVFIFYPFCFYQIFYNQLQVYKEYSLTFLSISSIGRPVKISKPSLIVFIA